jgi:hypothetical protein
MKEQNSEGDTNSSRHNQNQNKHKKVHVWKLNELTRHRLKLSDNSFQIGKFKTHALQI